MISFGNVPAGSVLPIIFGAYNSSGASVTLSGLAVTDIEVYKGTSMTQRASDAGYTLLDTDGIDIDGTTGIHGFSIDTGDNTDSGFYAAGGFFTVVVSAVTIDSQTVNFVAATFRLVAAEATAGLPSTNVTHAAGTAWNSGAIGASTLASDTLTAAKVADDVSTEIRTKLEAKTVITGTVTTGSSTTSIPTSALSVAGSVADQFKGRIIIFDNDTSTAALRGQATDITASSNAATPTFTVTALTSSPASGDTFRIV